MFFFVLWDFYPNIEWFFMNYSLYYHVYHIYSNTIVDKRERVFNLLFTSPTWPLFSVSLKNPSWNLLLFYIFIRNNDLTTLIFHYFFRKTMCLWMLYTVFNCYTWEFVCFIPTFSLSLLAVFGFLFSIFYQFFLPVFYQFLHRFCFSNFFTKFYASLMHTPPFYLSPIDESVCVYPRAYEYLVSMSLCVSEWANIWMSQESKRMLEKKRVRRGWASLTQHFFLKE